MSWNFYGWFVFAPLFIAAYFVWVWTSSRRIRRNRNSPVSGTND